MLTKLTMIAALTFAVGTLTPARATAQGASTAPIHSKKELREAESSARTPAEHVRIAAYYQSEVKDLQARLAEQEEMVAHYSFMSDRTKLPNAYSSSKNRAEYYRSELAKASKLAADHEKMAQSGSAQ
jgi:hypothetical protein